MYKAERFIKNSSLDLRVETKSFLAGGLEYFLRLNSRTEAWKINELVAYLADRKEINQVSARQYLSMVEFTRSYAPILNGGVYNKSINNRSVAFTKSILLVVKNNLFIAPYPACKISRYFSTDFSLRDTSPEAIASMEEKYLITNGNLNYDRIAIEPELQRTAGLESFDFRNNKQMQTPLR